jgi:hypothetical protein
MSTLGAREVPLPDHVDVYSLSGEVEAGDRTALQAILDEVDSKVNTLEALSEHLLDEDGPESEVLQEVYARLDELDVQTAPRVGCTSRVSSRERTRERNRERERVCVCACGCMQEG